jgi:hypothetical protein
MNNEIKKEACSPEKAKDILSRVDHKHQHKMQRKIRPNHVAFLAGEVLAGQFTYGIVHLLYLERDKVWFLINGQHTLRAIIEADTEANILYIAERVEDYDTVVHHYQNFDRGLGRSMTDTLRVFGVAEKTGLSNREITKIIAALKFAATGFTTGRFTRVNDLVLIKAAEEISAEYIDYRECIRSGRPGIKGKMLNRAYLSVALLTFRYNPDKARQFWRDVAERDRLPNDSPAFQLADLIRYTALYGGGVSITSSPSPLDPKVAARSAAVAWNAYYQDDPLHKPLDRYSMKEFKLLGVPLQEVYTDLEERFSLKKKDRTMAEVVFTNTPFSKIRFTKKWHKYHFGDTQWTPVTQYVKALHPPFDADSIARRVSEQTGRSVKEIRGEWSGRGKQAIKVGNLTHDYIRQVLSGEIVDRLRYQLNGGSPVEFDAFDVFWKRNRGIFRPVKVEWIVGDQEYKLAGTVDALMHNEDEGYVLVDWKTGKLDEWNREKFHSPFEDIPNDALYHYSFQLSLYRLIIERNTNIKIGKMYIIHLRYDGESEVVPALDYSYRLGKHLAKTQ